MSLTPDEQSLYDFARNALPSWLKDTDEFLVAAAKTFGLTLAHAKDLMSQALITQAVGATSTTPDWLNQHARDRGTSRQQGEGDAALQERLRSTPDALTRAAILDAANAILTAAGVAGSAALLELPRDAAWIGDYDVFNVGDPGGVFAHAGSLMSFTSALDEIRFPWTPASVFPGTRYRVTITLADNGGNNGTFEVVGLVGNAILYSNASGVNNAADGSANVVFTRLDALGNPTDGFARAYVGRGWRVTRPRPFGVLVILPFGTSAGTAASVLASIRGKKAAGFKVLVERRANP